MKALPIICALLLPVSLPAADVKVGDSLEMVQASLGEPRGRLNLGDRQVLYFSRGVVEVHAGVATRVNLRSEEAQARYEARQAAVEQRAAEMNIARNAQLREEGEATKIRMLADESFKNTSLRYQVAYWRSFAVRYPMVSCLDELSLAQARLNEQVAAEFKNQEIMERLARLEADRIREDNERTYYPVYNTGYGYGYGHRRHYRRDDNCDRPVVAPVAPESPADRSRTAQDWLGVPRFVPLNPQI